MQVVEFKYLIIFLCKVREGAVRGRQVTSALKNQKKTVENEGIKWYRTLHHPADGDALTVRT